MSAKGLQVMVRAKIAVVAYMCQRYGRQLCSYMFGNFALGLSSRLKIMLNSREERGSKTHAVSLQLNEYHGGRARWARFGLEWTKDSEKISHH